MKSGESLGLTLFWVVLSSGMCMLEWGQELDSSLFTVFCNKPCSEGRPTRECG